MGAEGGPPARSWSGDVPYHQGAPYTGNYMTGYDQPGVVYQHYVAPPQYNVPQHYTSLGMYQPPRSTGKTIFRVGRRSDG
jgi:hypothetical protein